MNDWTAGYVADIDYTFGYYSELNPLRLKQAFLSVDLMAPEVANACELGFGQGLSVGFHAAATTTEWYGTDFNPTHAGFAQEIVAETGARAQLFDQSFAEFCSRTDLPDFDFIGLHGIWSWISDDNRTVIVDFLRRKLKVGGVLYISYNTQPGWASMLPMRDLLNQHADVMGASGLGIVNRIDAALDFAGRMLECEPLFARANPLVTERINKMQKQNRHYLAHEYFNRDWHPMSFARMAEWLLPAKLNYACSANFLNHVDGINLTAQQQTFLKDIPDAMFRESVRDFMCNTQFRSDYWVKGARHVEFFDRGKRLRAQRIILIIPRETVELKVVSFLGEASLNENIYGALLDLLADHKPLTLGQAEDALRPRGVAFPQLLQAVMILIGKNNVALVQDDAVIAKAKRNTDKLNQYLMNKARSTRDIAYLVSPVTGGAIALSRFQQLFLLARTQGKRKPEEWAEFVWHHLSAMNQRLTKEGEPIESAEQNVAELTRQAAEFAEKRLPILKVLQIA